MSKASEILNAMYASTPLIFGHRGASAYAPANTLPAFQHAIEQGAHGVELDVQRSKDGFPIVIHDFRVDATTNGSGLVADLTLAELKSLDAGGWFSSEFAGTSIPTLDEVFEAVGQQLFINIEIKSISEETDAVEQVVADCIRRHQMNERVFVSSFNPYTLKRFRSILPDVPLGFLYSQETSENVYKLMEDFPIEAIHPQASMVDTALVEKAHLANQRVNVWTVNDSAIAESLSDMGVDCIISDNPDKLMHLSEQNRG